MKLSLCIMMNLITSGALFAQGTNNYYPLDTTDIKASLEMLGIQVYKFPITVHQKQTYRVNIIVEQSRNGKTMQTANTIEDFRSSQPQGTDPKNMPLDYVAPALDTGTTFLRVYIRHSEKTEMSYKYSLPYSSVTTSLEIDTSKYGSSNSRAFTYGGLKPRVKTPLVVYYMNTKGTPLLPCPGRATPDDVAKRYAFAVIIYAELVPVE